MAVSYKRLFHLLIERDMTAAQLQQQAGFSANITTRMKRNGYLSMETIERICRIMNCGVDDILEFISEMPTDKKQQNMSVIQDSYFAIILIQEMLENSRRGNHYVER